MNKINIWLSVLQRKVNRNSIKEKEEFYFIIIAFLYFFTLSLDACIPGRGHPPERMPFGVLEAQPGPLPCCCPCCTQVPDCTLHQCRQRTAVQHCCPRHWWEEKSHTLWQCRDACFHTEKSTSHTWGHAEKEIGQSYGPVSINLLGASFVAL